VSLRCLIVDDNAGFIAAARSLLEGQGISVVGTASSTMDAVQKARELRPDVALVDIDLGVDSGFDAARRLADASSQSAPAVILISTHDRDEFADLIETSPAVGFLAKTDLSAATIQQLLAASDESDAAAG
jgi:DNA-binding NarL/FixJ family response regulator